MTEARLQEIEASIKEWREALAWREPAVRVLADIAAELVAALQAWQEEISRLRQYEPPAMFQGTEIVWDDTTRAREERDEARKVARALLSEQTTHLQKHLVERCPWLK